MLLRIVIILLVILALLVGVSFFLPAEWQTVNAIEIDAPRAEIHRTVTDLRTWDEWTVWNEAADPDAEWSYEGEPGKGAVMRWQSEVLGSGSLTIEKADPKAGIEYRVELEGREPIEGLISYEDVASSDATRVVWRDRADVSNPFERWIVLALRSTIEEQFEQNLVGLKQRVEADPAPGDKPGEKPDESAGDKPGDEQLEDGGDSGKQG